MNAVRTYLDHNATAPLRPEAHAALLAALELPGNPSSVHAEGRRARGVMDAAREQVAALVGAKAGDVVFTSGGTEAANAVLRGGWDTIYLSALEHPAVAAPARASGARLVDIGVTADGVFDVAAFRAALEKNAAGQGRALLALQVANNETGVIQPVAEAAEIAHAHGLAVFADAVQAAGKLPVDFDALHADAIALSAHKIGGVKGVGALIRRNDMKVLPLVLGGGQERGLRGGTENVAGIAAFGAASEAATRGLDRFARLAALRDRLERDVRRLMPSAMVIGAGAPRLANTSCLAVPGRRAETLVIALDLQGVAVSAGAACSSGKAKRSAVLDAMGLGQLAESAIRISLGWTTRETDIEAFLRAFSAIVSETKAA